MHEVLSSVTRKVMENSGEGTKGITTLIAQIESGEPGIGYEVNSGKLVNMKEHGIIDPTKVLRLALQNSVGVGTSILTTNSILAVQEDKNGKKDR